MSGWKAVSLALSAAGAFALGYTIAGLRGSHTAPPLLVASPKGEIIAELTRLAREDRPPPPGWIRAGEESELRRFRLTAEQARAFFQLDHPSFVYDPLAYYVHASDLDKRFPLPEHPRGGWTLRTNSIGLRRDGEVAAIRPDLRVLVLGDSHIDGVCDNAEGFPALLEAELSRRHPVRAIEVLNAAMGGYEPYHYLGAFERYAELDPHACIAVWFGGNDFLGVASIAHVFEGTGRGGLGRVHTQARMRGLEHSNAAMGQGMASLHYFARRPDEVETALRVSREIALELKLLCAARGARLCIAYLPSPFDLPWREEPPALAELREMLALEEEHLAVHGRMADRFLAALGELDIDSLDLRPALAGPAENHFWRFDYHLSLGGQRALAAAFLPWLAAAPELER